MAATNDYQPHLAGSQPLPISAFHYYTPPMIPSPTVAASQPPPSITPTRVSVGTLDLTEDDFYDYTDFVSGGDQENWSIHNLPDILYQLRPVLGQWQALVPKNLSRSKRIPSPWKGEPALFKFKVLPNRVMSNVEAWRIEAWMRLDIRIKLEDIRMRMNPRFRKSTASLERKLRQFRKDFNITTWPREWAEADLDKKLKKPPDCRGIEKKLTRRGISLKANTTRGLTPGLIKPELGEAGGRIPVPDAYTRAPTASKSITPRKRLVRLLSESALAATSPLKRAINNAVLIRELSPTPEPPDEPPQADVTPIGDSPPADPPREEETNTISGKVGEGQDSTPAPIEKSVTSTSRPMKRKRPSSPSRRPNETPHEKETDIVSGEEGPAQNDRPASIEKPLTSSSGSKKKGKSSPPTRRPDDPLREKEAGVSSGGNGEARNNTPTPIEKPGAPTLRPRNRKQSSPPTRRPDEPLRKIMTRSSTAQLALTNSRTRHKTPLTAKKGNWDLATLPPTSPPPSKEPSVSIEPSAPTPSLPFPTPPPSCSAPAPSSGALPDQLTESLKALDSAAADMRGALQSCETQESLYTALKAVSELKASLITLIAGKVVETKRTIDPQLKRLMLEHDHLKMLRAVGKQLECQKE